MKRLFIFFISAGIIASLLASCSTETYKNIDYLQDVVQDSTWAMKVNQGIVIQPKDQVSIVVSCREPKIAAMFNLSNVSYQAGSEMVSGGGNVRLMGYAVSNEGDIDFPILGKMHVAGLTRWELSEKIKSELISTGMVQDPVVTVEFMNFKVSVMGEVSSPGTYTITGDKINLLEALSLAKDLTIYGRRDNVTVVREQNGERNLYKVDLRSKDLFESPAYYLQQNDVVYVYPNKVRAGQSTLNENSVRSTSFWMSLTSTLVSVATFIVAATR